MPNTLFETDEYLLGPSFPTEYWEILRRMHNVNPMQYAKTRNFVNGAVTFEERQWSFIGESARATPENSRNKGRIRQVGLVRHALLNAESPVL